MKCHNCRRIIDYTDGEIGSTINCVCGVQVLLTVPQAGRSRRPLLLSGLCAVLIAGGITIWALSQGRQSPPQRQPDIFEVLNPQGEKKGAIPPPVDSAVAAPSPAPSIGPRGTLSSSTRPPDFVMDRNVVVEVASANSIRIGNTIIHIPPPEGLVRVGPENKQFLNLQDIAVGSPNRLCAIYITADDSAKLGLGEPLQLSHVARIGTPRKNEDALVSAEYFRDLKTLLKDQQAQLFEQVRKTIPSLVDEATQKIGAISDADVKGAISGVVPLPVHEETENSISFSGFATGTFEIDGKTSTTVEVTTMAIVYVKGKTIFLTVVGEQKELDWTRQVLRNWKSEVIAANLN